jgi:hypothetical protein
MTASTAAKQQADLKNIGKMLALVDFPLAIDTA